MTRAVVGLGSCGIAAGGRAVYEALSTMFPARGLQVEITGCIGLCHREVLVSLSSPELGTCLYGDVTEENVGGLVESHFDLAVTVPEHLIWSDRGAEGSATLAHQVRLVLARTGRIDPGSVEAYIATGGYQGLERLLAQASPQQVIAEIHASGLRGRGGAGFPTATKWEIAHAQTAADKVIVCNADEGDPGAFMDRNLLEGDPFSVIEGMTVAAYAVGSRRGIVYVRDEYPLAIDRISVAIEQARTRASSAIASAGTTLILISRWCAVQGRSSAVRRPR